MPRKALSYLIRLVASAAILWYLFQQVDINSFQATLLEAKVGWLVVTVVLLLILRLGMSFRLGWVARCFDINPNFHTCVGIVFSSSLAGFVLPGGVATDVVRGFQLNNMFKNPSASLAAVLLDRYFGILSIFTLAALFFPFNLAELPKLIPWLLYTGLAVVATVRIWSPWLISLLSTAGKYTARITQLIASISENLRFAPGYFVLYGISFGIQIIRCLVLVSLFYAFDAGLNPLLAFVAVPIIFIIIMVPVSIGGLGVREGILVLLFVPLGVEIEKLVLIGFASHIIEFITTLPGVWYWIRGLPNSTDQVAAVKTQS